MTRAFRRLGSDRNSVAINKATNTPASTAVSHPTVGDITNGEVVSVTMGSAAPGAGTVSVGSRKTGAILLGTGDATNIDTMTWRITNGELLVIVTGTDVGTATLPFWVF